MEDERNTQLHHQGGEAGQETAADQVEVKDRGILDTLLGRKKPEDQEKKQEEELVTGMEKVTVAEPEKHEHKKEEHEAGEKKESLLAKLHRTSSSSSSSSDEEEEVIDENGEIVKRKKKKSLKEKIKPKMGNVHVVTIGETYFCCSPANISAVLVVIKQEALKTHGLTDSDQRDGFSWSHLLVCFLLRLDVGVLGYPVHILLGAVM